MRVVDQNHENIKGGGGQKSVARLKDGGKGGAVTLGKKKHKKRVWNKPERKG